MSIQNLASYDPFADVGDDPSAPGSGAKSGASAAAAATETDAIEAKKKAPQDRYIHIRIQQRNGRKTLTTLQGLPKGAQSSISFSSAPFI